MSGRDTTGSGEGREEEWDGGRGGRWGSGGGQGYKCVVWRCEEEGCGYVAAETELPLNEQTQLEGVVLDCCCRVSEVEFRSDELSGEQLWALALECQVQS